MFIILFYNRDLSDLIIKYFIPALIIKLVIKWKLCSQNENMKFWAVVAERLRRLTWNQIPSGSVGSNPTSCEINSMLWNFILFFIWFTWSFYPKWNFLIFLNFLLWMAEVNLLRTTIFSCHTICQYIHTTVYLHKSTKTTSKGANF